MNAPIDIVISFIMRHLNDQEDQDCTSNYGKGKIDAYRDLIKEFEGFKKLFN